LSRSDPGGAASVIASWGSAGEHASVSAPVTVAGRRWGVITVAFTREPVPAGAGAQLAGFAELAATAIASAQAQSFAEEQAALRRAGVLGGRGAPPAAGS